MQIKDIVKNCNGCSACIVGCKYQAIKMVEDENGNKYPRIDENGCTKCNNCVLYCPLYNPVKLPAYEEFYAYENKFYERDMPKTYRETMRLALNGKHAQFVGTLCQIAGLKSLLGDQLPTAVQVAPLFCDTADPRREECASCIFWKNAE